MKRNLQETFLVPHALVRDIQAALKENPRAFKDVKLNEESIYFISDSLLQSMSCRIKQIEETADLQAFYPLHSNILKAVCHNYKAHIELMIASGIVECDKHWIVGEKSLGYRFTEKYLTAIQEVPITDWCLKKAMRRRDLRLSEDRKAENKGYGYLTKWLEDGKLSIDKEKASQWIEKKVRELLAGADEFAATKIQFYSDLKRVNAKRFDDTLSSKDYKFTGAGHRFYSVLTNMPKELRGCLLYDGKPLVGVDISNSQPYLLPILFREAFWAKYYRGDQKAEKSLKFTDLKISKEEVCKVDVYTIIKYLKSFERQYGKDFQKINFFKLVLEGGLYEYIEPLFRRFYPEYFPDRKETKVQVLKILYSNPLLHFLECYGPCRLFNEFFPEVYPVLNAIRTGDYKVLPLILQSLESHLMIDIICKEISKKNPEVPLFTVHDSILTTLGNENIVYDAMKEVLKEYVGFEPRLKCEYPEHLKAQNVHEIWKDIPGYEGIYSINTAGKVKSLERTVGHRKGQRPVQEHILSSRIDNNGYESVRLSNNGNESTHRVHRLLALTYLSNILNHKQVNHKNGIKSDNRLENLEWVTPSQNTIHAYHNDLIKIKTKRVVDICSGEIYKSCKDAAILTGRNYDTLRGYLSGRKKNPTCLVYEAA